MAEFRDGDRFWSLSEVEPWDPALHSDEYAWALVESRVHRSAYRPVVVAGEDAESLYVTDVDGGNGGWILAEYVVVPVEGGAR